MATIEDGETFQTFDSVGTFPPRFTHTGFPRPVVVNLKEGEMAPCDFGLGVVHRVVRLDRDIIGRHFVVYDVVFFGGILIRTWIGE